MQQGYIFLPVFLIFCFDLIILVECNKKVFCDGIKNITLNVNEIVFIESPNYPNTMSNEMQKKCKLNIIGNFTKYGSMTLIIYFTIAHFKHGFLIDGTKEISIYEFDPSPFYSTNNTLLTFKFSEIQESDFVGFQGFVAAEQYNLTSCSFEQASQPFVFTNESEIFVINTALSPNYVNGLSKNCSWNFIGPKGYGFKFIPHLYKKPVHPGNLTVKNSTGDIITDSLYTRDNKPYYNEDHNITVIYQFNENPEDVDPIRFIAFITIVKKFPTRVSANCFLQKSDEKNIIWSNVNETSLYPNNAYCNFTTQIKPNQQLFVNYYIGSLEELADTLTYYIDNDTDHIIPVIGNFIIPPNENDTSPKTFTFEYLSDGSIEGKGFQLGFTFSDCKCNDRLIIVPCFGLTDFSVMKDAYGIMCANLQCNFDIIMDIFCHEKYIQLLFDVQQLPDKNYEYINLKYISNNQTVLETFATGLYYGLFQPKSKSTIEVRAGNLPSFSAISLSFFPQNKYKTMPKIILTMENPLFAINILDMQQNGVYAFELSEELLNDKIQVTFGDDPRSLIAIYADKNLTQPLNIQLMKIGLDYFTSIFTFDIPSIFIYTFINPNQELNLISLIVRTKKAHTKNCIFDDTIFYMNMNLANFNFDQKIYIGKGSMISNSYGPCEILLVNSDYFHKNFVIQWLWTNTKNEKIEIFESYNKTEKLLEFNDIEAETLQNLVLGSIFYVVIIPAHSSLVLKNLMSLNDFGEPPVISTPTFSIFETNNYGRLENTSFTSFQYIIENINTIFTVNKFDVSKFGSMEILDDFGNTRKVTAVYQTFEFYSTNLTLIFYEPNKGFKGIQFYINAFFNASKSLV